MGVLGWILRVAFAAAQQHHAEEDGQEDAEDGANGDAGFGSGGDARV